MCISGAVNLVAGEVDVAAGGSLTVGSGLAALRDELGSFYRRASRKAAEACSFSPETQIPMKDGTTKPIGDTNRVTRSKQATPQLANTRVPAWLPPSTSTVTTTSLT